MMRKVLLTQETIYKLQENGIYMTVNNRPADVERRSNKEIFYPDNCTVGIKTGLWGGNKFPNSIGSYSYSFSPLDTFFSIGNYCSIAVGLKIIGYRHPMERFTTSSITYDGSCPLFNRKDFHMKKSPVPPMEK